MANEKRDIRPDSIYHIYNRGNNKMTLFFDDEDFYRFLGIMKYYMGIYGIIVYAICIMSNHFHILLKDNGVNISLFMDSVESVYACYFIEKYGYKGRVFESRFKSNRATTEEIFLIFFRYINRNPVAAEIVANILHYKWSFLTPKSDRYKLIDFEYINDVFKRKCKTSYMDYLNSSVDDLWIDPIEVQRMEEADALNVFQFILNRMDLEIKDIYYLNNNEKVSSFINICISHGITIKQLNTFTGLSLYKVRKLKNQIKLASPI